MLTRITLRGNAAARSGARHLQWHSMSEASGAATGVLARWWRHVPLRASQAWLNILLLAIPAAILFSILGMSPLLIFAASALAIIPLAGVLGEATDDLSVYAGPTFGGLMNATMGNATEMIIAIFALREGHIEVVKASLSGSIIGNLLLVLGAAVVAGGLKRDKQTFSRTVASSNATMLFVAVVALVMPALYDVNVRGDLQSHGRVLQNLSAWTSGVLIALYGLSFLFMLKTHKALFLHHGQGEGPSPEARSLAMSLLALVTTTAVIGYMSGLLVGQIENVTKSLGMTEFFVGVIIVAVVGNAAEHSTAIIMAARNKMELAMTIAVGSSIQIALFVAPLLVFVSLLLGHPMTLIFNGFETMAIFLSVLIVQMISSDGETNWMEGAQLLAVYALLAVAFYFVPG